MIHRLRNNILALYLVVLFSVGICGCGVVIVAGLGALGGYVISPDTVEGVVGYSDKELYTAAIDILSIMGTINEQLKSQGHIVANVAGATTTLDIIPMSKSSTKFRVKARKWVFPKMAIAQDVYMKIVRRLQE